MRQRSNPRYIVFAIFLFLLFSLFGIGFCGEVYAQDSTYIKKLESNFNFYQKEIEKLNDNKKLIDEDIKRIEGILTYIRIEYQSEQKRLDSVKAKNIR